MKKFDLEAAKAGAPIITRDGRDVKFVAHVPECDPEHRVIAIIKNDRHPSSFSESGCSLESGVPFIHDLFMKPQKRTVWLNFYYSEIYGLRAEVFSSKKRALKDSAIAKAKAFAIPVEIEE